MTLLQTIVEEPIKTSFELFDKLGWKFFIRILFDLGTVFILVKFIYIKLYRSREKVFTFYLFNLIIFLITFLLNKVEMSMGAAFGLFAVFTMLRYRTEGISIKDMTYLFLTIALGLINAVTKGSWDELLLLNMILLFATFLLESRLILSRETSRIVLYEKIELIKPDRRKELILDLESRLGHPITHIQIGKVDFLKDAAYITVYYHED